MAKSASYLLKAEPARMQRWKEAAGRDKVSFVRWISDALDAKANPHELLCGPFPEPGTPSPRDKDTLRAPVSAIFSPRPRGKCPREAHHRKGSFCKSCGKVTI